MLQSILFIGATGMLGKPVAKILVDQGFEVTAMVRNPEKASKVLPQDIAMVHGDLKDIKTIERAIVGHDCIYLNLSINPNDTKNEFHTEKEGLDNLLKTLKHSGIKRLFYLSSLLQFYQSNWWALKIKRDALKKLTNSGIPTTVFYPSTFMETLDKKLLVGNRLILIGDSKYPMFWISAEDYAVQVANAIKIGNLHHENMEFTIQGKECYTMQEAAKIFKHNILKPIKVLKMSWTVLNMFRFVHPQLAYGLQISKAINNYKEQFNSQATWELLGKPDINLASYVKGLNTHV